MYLSVSKALQLLLATLPCLNKDMHTHKHKHLLFEEQKPPSLLSSLHHPLTLISGTCQDPVPMLLPTHANVTYENMDMCIRPDSYRELNDNSIYRWICFIDAH